MLPLPATPHPASSVKLTSVAERVPSVLAIPELCASSLCEGGGVVLCEHSGPCLPQRTVTSWAGCVTRTAGDCPACRCPSLVHVCLWSGVLRRQHCSVHPLLVVHPRLLGLVCAFHALHAVSLHAFCVPVLFHESQRALCLLGAVLSRALFDGGVSVHEPSFSSDVACPPL